MADKAASGHLGLILELEMLLCPLQLKESCR
jgi:hypothetical protein